jgi:uncharacterized membrane protein YgdD (TMEM256/DUF423 family)
MSRTFIILACINCFLAVGLGAFGAHGLKSVLSTDALQAYKTGVDYHFIHALGLMAIGILFKEFPEILTAGWIMFAGIVLFSGSLYVLSLTGIKALGMITPLGGLCFLIAWGWLAISVYKHS